MPEQSESPEFEADPVLLGAGELARTALLNITPDETIGEPVGHTVEGEHSLSLLFECTMTGYPGWVWTVSLSRIDENAEPFVLETELMPADNALLAPDWVPWSERLADYRTAQDVAAAQTATDELDDDIDEDDELDDDIDEDEDLDEDDLDDHGDDALDGIDFELAASPELHPGETDEAEGESDPGAPQPPAPAGRDDVGAEERQQHERQ